MGNPVYTTLLGLINAHNSWFGSEFIEMALLELNRLIITNQFEYGQKILQFLSNLCNCNMVKPHSLLNLFNTFVSVCKDEGPQVRKDWYVYAVLSSLPYIGSVLQENCAEELDIIFCKVDDYMSQRTKLHHKLLRVWTSDDPHPQEEYLDCLYAQICKLRKDNWVEDIISKPFIAFEDKLKQAVQHNIPPFEIPPHIENRSLYPKPRVIFRMFDYTDCEDGLVLPGNHAIERWVAEENVRDIIATYKKEKKVVAQRMLGLYDENKLPLTYIIIEVMFGDMFRLPTPPNSIVFYTAVFIELCKLQPTNFPVVLVMAVTELFKRLSSMNITCIDRFVNWFSHHLSNFKFSWFWQDWESSLSSDLTQPQPKFVKETLERCMRLAYYKKVCDMVPQSFEVLCPVDPVIEFKYEANSKAAKEDFIDYTTSQRIIANIKGRANDKQMIAFIESTISEVGPGGIEQPNYEIKRIELFTQTVLYLSKKSFSHSFTALSRYHQVFKSLTSVLERDGKKEILRSTREVWQHHPQMIPVIVDKMLRLQIVDCSSVANWIFSPEMATEFTRLYVWEIMHSTVDRMNAHSVRKESHYAEQLEKSRQVTSNIEDSAEQEMMNSYSAYAPDVEELKMLQKQITDAKNEQKKLFFTIFNCFKTVLNQHLKTCTDLNKDYANPWYINTIDRLKEVFLLHGDTVKQYKHTLGLILFNENEVDPRIQAIFEQYKAMEQ